MASMETLGSRIRAERRRLGIPLRRFAQMIGVSAPHVTDIETDRRRPSRELLGRIAEKLQIRLGELEELDTRLRPEVKEWMDEQPGVSQLLRRLKEAPDPEQLLQKLRKIVERETKEKD